MIITVYSRNRLYETFSKWDVPRDFADPMANYLVYGYEPGSCFTAILANDFYAAIGSSHPANTVEAFKCLVGWINDCMPVEAFGSYEAVKRWCSQSEDCRRAVLEKYQLIFTEQEEVWMTLQDTPTNEPVLY
jgi:hypothetical protein